jgi:putative secretion ATPase (PEP-CTERM system associated)
MYEQFFNLTAEPFRLSPDHRFCYNHSRYFKAKAYMAYAFLRAEGFVMITGRPGTGKTTLIGDLVESLADENVAVANLVSTQLAADDLLRMVAFAFGLETAGAEKSMLLQQLSSRFLKLHREGGRALLIVDEAQDLAPKAMEELRLLTNLQQDGKPLVQIFLLGQTELRDLVHDQGLEQVHQRIIAASHLEALSENETREYVEHRLKVVGWQNDPAISVAVFPIIHLFSEGVPRRINLICSRLFLQCCVEQRHQITVEDARSVVAELQEEQLSTRNLVHDDLFFAHDVFDGPLTDEPLEPASRHHVDKGAGSEPAKAAGPEVSPPTPSHEIAESPEPGEFFEPPAIAGTADSELEELLPDELAAQIAHGSSGASAELQSTAAERLVSSHTRVGLVGIETWLTLLAALLAGGVVALVAMGDRFL